MADNATLEPTERSELLQRFVDLDAISLLLANLLDGGSSAAVLRKQLPGVEPEAIGLNVSQEAFSALCPTDMDPDAEAPDFVRANALATILAGELFLELAASSEELAAEGRRLLSVGRRHLRASLDLDREEA